MLLEGKVAIVSGIGPGLGREVAFALARNGADLVLGARRAEALDALARELAPVLAASGGGAERKVVSAPTDVTRADDCARLAKLATDTFGRIDVLVNNAYHPGTYVPLPEDDLAGWRDPFEVNVLGSLRLTQAVLPAMRKQAAGSVVMINSMIVRRPLPTMGGYAASKAALLAATQTLAREVGSAGIRVNSVVPGYIWGPALEGYFAFQAKERGVDRRVPYDEVAREIPLGRIPTSAEVADAVLFFASDLSRAITGASLDVNGGQVMR